MKIKFYLGVGYVGCDREEIVDLPDDYTDEDIEEEFKSWVWENLDGNWRKVDPDA